MSNVLEMAAFKRRKRHQYFLKFGDVIDRFINRFADSYCQIDMQQCLDMYQNGLRQDYFESWDYIDLREILLDTLEQSIGDQLWDAAMQNWWFDPDVVTRQYLLEKCLSQVVLRTNTPAIASSD